MVKVQARTLKTRARLLDAAREIVSVSGYEALRVEEVVLRAGVAKGTFFSHFRDKDALMDQLIGEKIDEYLNEIETRHPPKSVEELVDILIPLSDFMTCERYVFDVILRHSGSAASDYMGPIAQTFERHGRVFGQWLAGGPFRRDIDANLLAEGIQAFSIQAMALKFCAAHTEIPMRDMLHRYFKAWLIVGEQA
ncbi:TetR/AcrR family transcriptional regulator [Cognatishimia activa]|uniref:TetR/AcrR family transcriptional regulator n=1 Tax=Cognatishimia activa TaxID=1715691 RepID=UPI00222E12C8|nr:TetR/AcrR family transcriptional regulator [Cognatishimia activa]UZD89920.1 TetR/AcrR family transcriptional regulator [Cognatishimia activa]